jgi:hypothetical protein
MAAKFILSLDCEGKWGVADHLTPNDHHTLSDARLREAYESILALLDAFDIAATFAFVGTFSLSADALRGLMPALRGLARQVPGYLEPALADIEGGSRQGWTGDWALAATATARAGHEIGLHGATHIPWSWPGMTATAARRELGLLYSVRAPVLERATTFVFPRNAVAHSEVLREFGIAGLRAARPHPSRLASLAAEFDLFTPPDQAGPPADPIEIPAGHFVNWRSGGRRLVPVGVSRLRARNMLARAERSDGVVHYWTHPENIASAPQTLSVLRGIIEDVARLRDAGRCEVLTQETWCRRLDPELVSRAEARRDDRLAGRSA